MVLLVNKSHIFNEEMIKDFAMVEYENYCEKTLYIEEETFRHFEMLKAHLRVDGIIIDLDDAYRSLETQENIFIRFMKSVGMEEAEKTCAMPGYSEHHTGQALDLVLYKDDQWIVDNDKLIQEEEIFKKIHSCLKYFGFILRYPKGKEDITGYSYEPWHIRYIGDDAMKIGDKVLEEYLDGEE